MICVIKYEDKSFLKRLRSGDVRFLKREIKTDRNTLKPPKNCSWNWSAYLNGSSENCRRTILEFVNMMYTSYMLIRLLRKIHNWYPHKLQFNFRNWIKIWASLNHRFLLFMLSTTLISKYLLIWYLLVCQSDLCIRKY